MFKRDNRFKYWFGLSLFFILTIINIKGSKKLKTILLVVQFSSHFSEISRVVRLLMKSGSYNPILWFKAPYDTIERDLAICNLEGWEYISPLSISVAPKKKDRIKLSYFRMKLSFFLVMSRDTIKKIKNLAIFTSLNSLYICISYYISQANFMRSTLQKIQPDLIIVAEDTVGYGLSILIKIGNKLSIPTVIVPFTIANATEPARYFFDFTELILSKRSIKHRIIEYIFPQWVYCYNGRKLLRMSPCNIFSLELLGYAPRNPWIYNSEETSLIAVENEHMYQYYQNEGFPLDRLIITGALTDDIFFEGLMNKETNRTILYKDLNLIQNQPLLLCALPPSQFPINCEFSDYSELVDYWMKILKSIKGWNVLVCPHPRQGNDVIELLKKYNIQITQKDTASLIPLCDLYVASVSATIRWAIACGKPVVNYDVYQMDYLDYVDVKGVITVNNKESFRESLWNLTCNHEYYNNLATYQKECMSEWGILDGLSGERMLHLFNDVIENSKRACK